MFLCERSKISQPSQVGTWLGFHLDFSLNFIIVPLPKITKLQESISHILALHFVNAKDLAIAAGQLNSMFLAIGNIVRLRRNPPDVGVTSGQKSCTKIIYIVLQTSVGLF